MSLLWLVAATMVSAADPASAGLPAEGPGVLAGVVVNRSADDVPVAEAEVVLRLRWAGQLVLWSKTRCDQMGRFCFQRLPVSPECLYLPGANRHGVHYPGPRVQLTAAEPRAMVQLSVYDAIESPNPLVLHQHDVTVRAEPNALHVTESLCIENPTRRCYVGQPGPSDQPPVTLELGIPLEFERATFDKEFFGRRFSVGKGGLVTGVPWPPGRHELRFTYTLPRNERQCAWQRWIDLPCRQFRLVVEAEPAARVECNLPAAPRQPPAGMAFSWSGPLEPGQRVEVILHTRAVSPQVAARWAAVGLLATAVAAGATTAWRAHRRAKARRP